MTRTDDDLFRFGAHRRAHRRRPSGPCRHRPGGRAPGRGRPRGPLGPRRHPLPVLPRLEVHDRRIVQIVTHPRGLHIAPLFRQLSPQLTVVLHDPVGVDDFRARCPAGRRCGRRARPVSRIVTGADDHVEAVELADHARIDADTVVVSPSFKVRIEPFTALGLRAGGHQPSRGLRGDGRDGGDGRAGPLPRPQRDRSSQQVVQAAADGSRVGAMISLSLADDDLRPLLGHRPTRPTGIIATGAPRCGVGTRYGTLVKEISGLASGRALDVGTGEGSDTLWLAEQGWNVTASDISQRTLDRVDEKAA